MTPHRGNLETKAKEITPVASGEILGNILTSDRKEPLKL